MPLWYATFRFFEHGVLHVSKKFVAILLASALTAGQAFAANVNAGGASQSPLAAGGAAGVKQAQAGDIEITQDTALALGFGVVAIGAILLLKNGTSAKVVSNTSTSTSTSTSSTTTTKTSASSTTKTTASSSSP